MTGCRTPSDIGRTRPSLITFTGADDATDQNAMVDIAGAWPVEFGVLISASRQGQPRYPNWAWIDHLRARGLNLAAHVCGRYARSIATEGSSEIDDRLAGFARVQINTTTDVNLDAVGVWAARQATRFGHPVMPILQCRGDFPEARTVSWLYDRSGGTGLLADDWPPRPGDGRPVGYAGGLGPETITDAIRRMPDLTGCWLDMETGVRDDLGLFSPDLCRQVCMMVYGAPARA